MATDSIYTGLRQLLRSSTALVALVGDRIRPFGTLKQNEVLPAVTMQRVSSRRWPTFGADYGHVEVQVQVDSFAETEREALDVAEQVRLALRLTNVGGATGSPIRGTILTTERDWYEDATESYRVLQQWTIHHSE